MSNGGDNHDQIALLRPQTIPLHITTHERTSWRYILFLFGLLFVATVSFNIPVIEPRASVRPLISSTLSKTSATSFTETSQRIRFSLSMLPDGRSFDSDVNRHLVSFSDDSFADGATSNGNEEGEDNLLSPSPEKSGAPQSTSPPYESLADNVNDDRKSSMNTTAMRNTPIISGRSSGGAGGSRFAESTLLPPPPTSGQNSSSTTGFKRVHMRRGKDNSRHYYQLRKPSSSTVDASSRASWRPSNKRPPVSRLRTGKQHSIPQAPGRQRLKNNSLRNSNSSTSYSSLLPPPLSKSMWTATDDGDSPPSPGLSSWEDFLGTVSLSGNVPSSSSESSNVTNPPNVSSLNATEGGDNDPNPGEDEQNQNPDETGTPGAKVQQQLPAFGDLFPPSLATSPPKTTSRVFQRSPFSVSRDGGSTSSGPLEGVLPVSDLFYHVDVNFDSSDPSSVNGGLQNSMNGKIHSEEALSPPQPSKEQLEMIKKAGKRKETGRKMVRRGMEMLVGGVPISADPPQRALEIYYEHDKENGEENWASAICTNTDEYGPLLCRTEVDAVPLVERGLFCEFFANYSIKWEICPDYLKSIVKNYVNEQSIDGEMDRFAISESRDGTQNTSFAEVETESDDEDDDPFLQDHVPTHDEEDEEDGMLLILVRPQREGGMAISTESDTDANLRNSTDEVAYEFHIGKVEIGINVSIELLNSTNADRKDIMKSVLTNGLISALGDQLMGMIPRISRFAMFGLDNGSTRVAADFVVRCTVQAGIPDEEILQRAKQLAAAFAMSAEGDIALEASHASRLESRWSPEIRELVAEEFLVDDNDDEEEAGTCSQDRAMNWTLTRSSQVDTPSNDEQEDNAVTTREFIEEPVPSASSSRESVLSVPSESILLPSSREELILSTSTYANYSADNALFAPYKGELGLRLVDAVVQRYKERHPRVIAIGDVHGCIDELKDLLRQCDYSPGDLVVFLGDLVCKGPDSVSVVQMAREIGALGVRGNHDFEVIRWHRAIMAGVDPPTPRSEHFFIASRLGKQDVKWMCNLPWYISSNDLSALFVHAGFVSGIRLSKQNPRLMTNMRSILPDGTVTSKFFNNWPWARLWDGPQTVLFGHDADRGLQQYEHAIGLDTGCVYGGQLTACILPERRFVSVNARREYFKYRRKHYD